MLITKKKLVFLSGTRADFGKLKSLIEVSISSGLFEVFIFATGMHLLNEYGSTVREIEKCGYKNIKKFKNCKFEDSMDRILSNTIRGLSTYINKINPDLIIVHGDRVETLAGAIVGSLNNILVAHIEGGEVSGTIDELIRHSVSKLSHIHFVSNEEAKKRLIQMGEIESSIFLIGSPDVDIMISNKLPTLTDAKSKYEIHFDEYAILMFHPITTEINLIEQFSEQLVNAVIKSGKSYVVIFPNNDLGSHLILNQYKKLTTNPRFRIFPSIRFEYFLTILKHSKLLVGNSSAGIREAPYYGIPVVNIGTRQNKRTSHKGIKNCDYNEREILESISKCYNSKLEPFRSFGNGNSNKLFIKILTNKSIWEINHQKQFKDL